LFFQKRSTNICTSNQSRRSRIILSNIPLSSAPHHLHSSAYSQMSVGYQVQRTKNKVPNSSTDYPNIPTFPINIRSICTAIYPPKKEQTSYYNLTKKHFATLQLCNIANFLRVLQSCKVSLSISVWSKQSKLLHFVHFYRIRRVAFKKG